jgi:hypothetical protein
MASQEPQYSAEARAPLGAPAWSAATTHQNRPRRVARKLVLSFAAALVAVLGTEGGYRIYLWLSGRPYSVWKTEESMRAVLGVLTRKIPLVEESGPATHPAPFGITEPAADTDMLHPYYGIENKGFVAEISKAVAYFATPEAEKNLDILVVGGSAAALFSATAGNLLVAGLEREPALAGRHARIFGQGRGGFKQPQQVMVVAYLLSLGWKPDAIVNIDGFNEVALANDNNKRGANPVFPVFAEWTATAQRGTRDRMQQKLLDNARERREHATAIYERAVGWRLTSSAILGTIELGRLTKLYNDRFDVTEAYLKFLETEERDPATLGPPFVGNTNDAIAAAVRAWAEGSRMLRAICGMRGIRYVHLLQPTMLDEGSKPLTEEEIHRGSAPDSFREGVRLGYPQLRAEGARLRAEGEAFIDATGIFKNVKDNLYLDNCHFGENGNRLLAIEIAKALAAP